VYSFRNRVMSACACVIISFGCIHKKLKDTYFKEKLFTTTEHGKPILCVIRRANVMKIKTLQTTYFGKYILTKPVVS
jgi:hypothetical protein